MNLQQPLALLGGLSPQTFMRRHWQKKPLLIRAALPGMRPLLSRSELFALAAQDAVESRLIVQNPKASGPRWQLRHGPLSRRMLPPLNQAAWTLLVQGIDLHDDRAHALLQQFRFIPDARLDDLMVSYATDGGGVGPHFDSYDVFLLQVHGQRRWRIGRQKDLRLQDDVPLKILAEFEPEEEFVLEPGDMLYLPPRYAHDGIAQGECMTYSIGFRAPAHNELAHELLLRIADQAHEALHPQRYTDKQQSAVSDSAEIPAHLLEFAHAAVQAAVQDPQALACALGEYLTEPKAQVWFDAASQEDADAMPSPLQGPLRLDRRTRMLYRAPHVFINGESFVAAGRDATSMQHLANQRSLDAAAVARLSASAKDLLARWRAAGWLVVDEK